MDWSLLVRKGEREWEERLSVGQTSWAGAGTLLVSKYDQKRSLKLLDAALEPRRLHTCTAESSTGEGHPRRAR